MFCTWKSKLLIDISFYFIQPFLKASQFKQNLPTFLNPHFTYACCTCIGNLSKFFTSVDTSEVTLESISHIFCFYSYKQREDLQDSGKFSLIISEEVMEAHRWIYPRESPLCFCPVLCSTPIHCGSCLGLLPCSSCFCDSQEDSIHTKGGRPTKAFEIYPPPAVVVFLTEEQRIHSHQFFQDHQEPEASTQGTHSKNGLQEHNFFSTLPLFPPFTGNGIQFKKVKQSTDSILPNLFILSPSASWGISLSNIPQAVKQILLIFAHPY